MGVMGGTLIEEQVADILKERGLTVSVAEACTSGLIAAKLTSVPGARGFLLGAFCVCQRYKRECAGHSQRSDDS